MKKKRKTPEGKPLWQVLMEDEGLIKDSRFLQSLSGREPFIEPEKISEIPFDNPPEKSE